MSTPFAFALTFKIAEVFEPKDLGEDPYDHPEYYDQQATRMDFFKNATLARVTLKDGVTHWVGRMNFNGGVCSCCSQFNLDNIVKFERLEPIQE